MRKKREEIKSWLLENCIDENGDLDLMYLDFSDFEGNVDISFMKVKGDLYQHNQRVGRNLYQDYQEVKGDLSQYNQEVKANLLQGYQKVEGNLYQSNQKVSGKTYR